MYHIHNVLILVSLTYNVNTILLKRGNTRHETKISFRMENKTKIRTII